MVGSREFFVRTPGSGAWKKISKATNEASKSAVADIVTPNNFPFTIEAKKDESFEFRHLLDNYQDCTLAKWLDKLENEDCLISKKKPNANF